MKIKGQSLSIVASIVLATSFIGCSGGKGIKDTVVTSVKGSAVDGYISGATICLDVNNNSLCEANEVSVLSDNNGKYSLPIKSLTEAQRETVRIIAFGGIDTASNKPFQGILKAPLTPDEEIINMNALTTIAAIKIVKNSQALVEIEKVAKSLGLKTTDITKDILKSSSKKAYQEALKLQKSLEILAEALPSNTKIERLENIRRIQLKLAEGFDGTASNVNDILEGTVFDNTLADVENIKTQAKNIISSVSFENEDTLEEMERKQLLLEEKRDILVTEVNRIKSIGGDLGSDLKDIILNQNYNAIDNLYTAENRVIIKMINILELNEDLSIADLADLVIIFQDAAITTDDNIAQVEVKLKAIGASNVGLLDRVLFKIKKRMILNNNENENYTNAIAFLLKLNLTEQVTNTFLLAAITELGLKEDMTITEIINTINNSSIDEIQKLDILKVINDAIEEKKAQIASIAFIALSSSTAAGSDYTEANLVTFLSEYGTDYTMDNYVSEFIKKMSADTELDTTIKATLLNAFSFAL